MFLWNEKTFACGIKLTSGCSLLGTFALLAIASFGAALASARVALLVAVVYLTLGATSAFVVFARIRLQEIAIQMNIHSLVFIQNENIPTKSFPPSYFF